VAVFLRLDPCEELRRLFMRLANGSCDSANGLLIPERKRGGGG
jgi:hypothetical protein